MKTYEGTIISCDGENHVYRYLVEDRGRIVYVGNNLPPEYQGSPREGLGERSLLPCFGDTHLHFASYALFNAGLDVRSAASIPELCGVIKRFAADNGDKIIMGFGASTHAVQEKRLISREELDGACPDRAIFIIKYDGHACILNTKTLAMLPEKVKTLRGYHADTGEMNPGSFFCDHGFHDQKSFHPAHHPEYAPRRRRYGGKGHRPDAYGLRRRIPHGYGRRYGDDPGKGTEHGVSDAGFLPDHECGQGQKRKLPRIGGCFATALDGCFGSEDAAMQLPYTNNPDNRGILFHTDEEVVAFAKRANRAGLQIEMHAIGDAAFDQAVMALEAALADCPWADHRHGSSMPAFRPKKG